MEKLTGGTLTPAYGRDYSRREQIVDDLNAGKDFMIAAGHVGGYCSIRNLADGQFQARDFSKRKLWVINVKDGKAR